MDGSTGGSGKTLGWEPQQSPDAVTAPGSGFTEQERGHAPREGPVRGWRHDCVPKGFFPKKRKEEERGEAAFRKKQLGSC